MSNIQTERFEEAKYEAEREAEGLTQEFNDWLDKMLTSRYSSRDNLFSANHRTAMIKKYGYTEAEFVSVEELE